MAIIILVSIMKLTANARKKLATMGIAISLAFVPFALPATVGAANPCNPNDKQCVDVCGTGTRAAACNTFVEKYVNPIVLVLTAMVGISAVLSIVIAGIQYTSSADDSGIVNKAKTRIFNTIIGLVAYIFMLAFLNYLVPGGIF